MRSHGTIVAPSTISGCLRWQANLRVSIKGAGHRWHHHGAVAQDSRRIHDGDTEKAWNMMSGNHMAFLLVALSRAGAASWTCCMSFGECDPNAPPLIPGFSSPKSREQDRGYLYRSNTATVRGHSMNSAGPCWAGAKPRDAPRPMEFFLCVVCESFEPDEIGTLYCLQ